MTLLSADFIAVPFYGVAGGGLGVLSVILALWLRIIPDGSGRDIVHFTLGIAAVGCLAGLLIGVAMLLANYRALMSAGYVSQYVGEGPVEVRPGAVYRSTNGTHQFRSTCRDSALGKLRLGSHVHLEELDPSAGIILNSWQVGIDHVRSRGRTGPKRPVSFATLGEEQSSTLRVEHFLGRPPEVGGLHGRGHALPRYRILVLEGREDDVILWRFADNGAYAGDTWHETADDAKRQAAYEYGEAVSRWDSTEVPIPPSLAAVLSRFA